MITRVVTVAAGVYAPGHLGELTQYLPFEVVDDVLEQTGTVQRRLRDLPSRIGLGLQSLRQGEADARRSGGAPSGLNPVALTRDRMRFLKFHERLSHIN